VQISRVFREFLWSASWPGEMNAGSGKSTDLRREKPWKTECNKVESLEDTFDHGCLIDDAAIKHTSSDAVISTNGH